MIHDEREKREELALDALAASFFCISPDEEPEPVDDLEILDEADRQALMALGDDLIDRLLLAEKPLPPPLTSAPPNFASPIGFEPGTFLVPPEMTSLHRGDEDLTESAEEELERRRRELLDVDDEKSTG
jgi:hypothetical protein